MSPPRGRVARLGVCSQGPPPSPEVRTWALRLPKFRRGAASGGRSFRAPWRASLVSLPADRVPATLLAASTGSAAPAPAPARFPSVGVGRSVAWAREEPRRRGPVASPVWCGGAGPARGVPARPPPPPPPCHPPVRAEKRARGSGREGRSWGPYRVRGGRPRVPLLPLPRPGVARSGAGPRDAAVSVRRRESPPGCGSRRGEGFAGPPGALGPDPSGGLVLSLLGVSPAPARPSSSSSLRPATSDQTWRPAEFKHISQRRKRN